MTIISYFVQVCGTGGQLCWSELGLFMHLWSAGRLAEGYQDGLVQDDSVLLLMSFISFCRLAWTSEHRESREKAKTGKYFYEFHWYQDFYCPIGQRKSHDHAKSQCEKAVWWHENREAWRLGHHTQAGHRLYPMHPMNVTLRCICNRKFHMCSSRDIIQKYS